ncbi:hypothetical protein QBC47DRAFT_370807 [Echria macrotheca]|uniref:Uncharacterized protein n=1 Tax=Echria macrotheca TaxID=438768 RepID=A0AAJ0BJ76_9PEZI|nr:hypothetical protein QBC47DRAFT_370807 [Echria macrotheca]
MPPPHKRNLPSDGAVPAAKKTKQHQLAVEMPTPTTLEEALTIIDMFKADQTALINHIMKTDKNLVRAPPTIRALTQHGDPSILAEGIKKGMASAYTRLEEKFEHLGWKRGAVTIDDVCCAMEPFLDAIEDMLGKNGDQLTKLRLAYDLLFELKRYTSCGFDSFVCYGRPVTDKPADKLLSAVIWGRKEAGDTWDWKKDLEHLERKAKDIKDYGIEPWFPKSIKALATLCGREPASEPGEDEDYSDDSDYSN